MFSPEQELENTTDDLAPVMMDEQMGVDIAS